LASAASVVLVGFQVKVSLNNPRKDSSVVRRRRRLIAHRPTVASPTRLVLGWDQALP